MRLSSNTFAGKALYILIVGIVALTVVDTHLFVYSSLSKSLLPNLLVNILSIICCCVLFVHLWHGRNERFPLKNIGVLLLWIAYLLVYPNFIQYEEYRLYYLLSSLFFCLTLTTLFNVRAIVWRNIENIFILISLCNIIVVLAQATGFIRSLSEYFCVTGLDENPSVTAISLVCCTPVIVNRIKERDKKYSILYISLFLLLLLSILLLKCRSAIVGTAVSLLIITATRCWSIAQKVTKPRLILFSVLFIIASLLAGMYIYNAKKKSSDGRLLIWKLSTELINARPQGYGYGLFEKYYNQQQSSYFLDNKRPAEEIMIADHVSMAYNDFIEQCVEGGIIGGMLYLLFFLHTIRLAYKKKDIIAVASLVAILMMSMLNFIYTAPQCWIFTMCIAAKVFSENKDMSLTAKHYNNVRPISVLYIAASAFSFALLYENIKHTKAQTELTTLYSELAKGNIHNQEHKYYKLSEQVGTSELFYTTWAKYNIKRKHYDAAIANLLIASQYTSSPNVYFLMSECYARSGNTTYAINCLRFLSGMLPHHFYPEIYLLRAYDHIGKTDEAMEIAQHIISKPVKISSNQTFNIKNEACQYIREHE